MDLRTHFLGGAPIRYLAVGSHKLYAPASVEEVSGGEVFESRIEHARGSVKEFLRWCEPGQPVDVEMLGNWYWIVEPPSAYTAEEPYPCAAEHIWARCRDVE